MSALIFSERQRGIIATALTSLSLVVMAALVLWLVRQVLAFFVIFSGIFLPLAVAGILATLMKPFYSFVHDALKSKVAALAVVVLSLALPMVLVMYFFGVMILGQISSFLGELPVWIEKVQLFMQERMPALRELIAEHDVKARLMAVLEGKTDLLTSSAMALGQGVVSTGSAFFSVVAGLLGWLVMPVYFIYFIQAPGIPREKLESGLPFLRPETKSMVIYLATEFVNILVAFFRGQLVIALAQGVLYAVGFSLAGLRHGAILGLLLGFLNIIPYLGNIVGLAVVLPLAWFHPAGGLPVLLGVSAVFVMVQLIESYVLTPRIMGKTTGLHPLVIIVAILFWGTAFSGLLGMILAIPLTAFLVVFWRLLRERYIKEWL